MRRSTLAFLTLPLLILGCGGSSETGTTPAPPSGPSTRATFTFKLDTGSGGSGQAVVSFASQDSYYKYYEGTWKGQKIRFAEGQGIGSVSIWNGNLAIASYTFLGYGTSDFPTATKQSSTGQYSFYDSALKTQIKFKLAAATASP